MDYTKKTILIMMLIFVVVGSADGARNRRMTAQGKRAKALKLLNKYAETQKKLQSSFIIKSELVTDDQQKGFVFETRYDGNRIFWGEKHWGTKMFDKGKELYATKDNPSYLFYMFDGKRSYSHLQWLGKPGRVIIGTKKDSKMKEMNKHNYSRSHESNFHGFCYGNDDRIDRVLRRADNIRFDQDIKKVGDYNCYHIQSKTKEGTFNVWISPELDYNIVKMNASYKEGDVFFGVRVPETGKIIWQSEISDFKKVDGIWVPMEVTSKLNRQIPARNHKLIQEWHRKRTEVILNPDHEKLNSFGTDFIPNGAKAHFTINPNVNYIWQNGKVVDDKGRTVMDCMKKPKGNKK